MKKALMGFQGYIHEIRDPGEDYQIYEGPDATIAWVDAPDDITINWTLEWSPSNKCSIWCKRSAPFTDLNIARKVAYGDVGEQLGMLFDDLKTNGTLSTDTSSWFQHIDYIKSVIPAPPPPDGRDELHLEDLMQLWQTEEPSVDKMAKLSSPSQPCWVKYPGWKGYTPEAGMPVKGTII
jgi:hypothetical protein